MRPKTYIAPQECTFYYQGKPVGRFQVLDMSWEQEEQCFWTDPFTDDPDIVITDLNDIL